MSNTIKPTGLNLFEQFKAELNQNTASTAKESADFLSKVTDKVKAQQKAAPGGEQPAGFYQHPKYSKTGGFNKTGHLESWW